MATITSAKRQTKVVDYPTSDGRPMAETQIHRDVLIHSYGSLDYWYRDEPNVYVCGNMLMYYEEGNKRKHVAPDIFVVLGISKKKREYYLLWEEPKGPDVVIEATSKTTVKEDIVKKELYRTVLHVNEFFLFDPTSDYLDPRLQGFRLVQGLYKPIKIIDGRLPSKKLQSHLEADGENLRFYNPLTHSYVPTPQERAEQEKQRADRLAAEVEKLRAELARHKH